MTLNEYQTKAMQTCMEESKNLNYMALGLASEAGEVAGKAKKLIRDGEFDRRAALKELGDVLWYVAGCACELGYTLEDVARVNIAKLEDRRQRDAISGEGDDR